MSLSSSTTSCLTITNDKGHILLVNGYECITLGHNLNDKMLQHPYYGTDKVTQDLLNLPGAEQGFRTARGLDLGDNRDYATQGVRPENNNA